MCVGSTHGIYSAPRVSQEMISRPTPFPLDRDLKPRNVMLGMDGHIQLADMGGVGDCIGDMSARKVGNTPMLLSLSLLMMHSLLLPRRRRRGEFLLVLES